MLLVYPLVGFILAYFVPDYTYILQFFDIIFLRLINLVVPYLVFTMILKSVSYIVENIDKDKTIFWVILYYSGGTLFSVILSFLISLFFELGRNQSIDDLIMNNSDVVESNLNIIDSIVPSNLITALHENNLIQLLVIAIGLGVILRHSKFKSSILHGIDCIYGISFEVINYIMLLAPYALLSLTIKMTIQGFNGISDLTALILIFMFLYVIRYVILLLEIYFIGGISPFPFIIKSTKYQVLAFLTCSSKGVMPVAAEEMSNMGCSKKSVEYGVSIGSMLNLIGFGVDLTATVIFIINLYGIEMTWFMCGSTIFLCFIGVIVGAGIPGGSLIALSIVLNFLGIPLDIMCIIVALERIMDMFSTTLIVTGIVGSTLTIDAYKEALDKNKYYS